MIRSQIRRPAMKRKIDAVVKEEGSNADPKEVKMLGEEGDCADLKAIKSLEDERCAGPKEVDSLEEEGDCAVLKAAYSLDSDDDFSDSDSDSDDDSDSVQSLDKDDDVDVSHSVQAVDSDSSGYSSVDEEEELLNKPSHLRSIYKWYRSKDLALRLKDNLEVFDLSSKILNYFKDGGDANDVESFSEMVNKLLANNSFQKEMIALSKFPYYLSTIIHFAYLSRKYLKPADQLSRIKRDWILKKENHWFFNETLKGEEHEMMVVRGALSILIPYCISLEYLDKTGVSAADNA